MSHDHHPHSDQNSQPAAPHAAAMEPVETGKTCGHTTCPKDELLKNVPGGRDWRSRIALASAAAPAQRLP